MEPATAASLGFQVLDRAWKALEALRERAQTSKDAELKANISQLYDEFLAMKSILVRLSDENEQLRESQKTPKVKPELRQVGRANYYFVGDKGPFCQPCYDTNQKLVNLTPHVNWGSRIGRRCLVCRNSFTEESAPPQSVQITPWS